MRLTIGRKLGAGFGLLLAIFLIIGLISFNESQNVINNISGILKKESPKSALAYEQEIYAIESEIGVLSYLFNPDDRIHESLKDHDKKFKKNNTKYLDLLSNNPEKLIGKEVVDIYVELMSIGESLMYTRDYQRNLFLQLALYLERTDKLFERVLFKIIIPGTGENEEKKDCLRNMKESLVQIGSWIGSYASTGKIEYSKRIAGEAGAFLENHNRLLSFELSPEEKKISEEIESSFKYIHFITSEIVGIDYAFNKYLNSFSELRQKLHKVLHDDISGTANQDLETASLAGISAARSVTRNIIGLIILAFLSGGLIVMLLAKDITESVNALILTAERIGKGQLNERVTIKSRDEFASLGNAVNNMARDLERYLNEKIEAQKAIHEGEEHMRSIFRAAPTGIGVVRNRIITKVNNKFCEMLGYTREELIGKSARFTYFSSREYERVGREKYAQIEKTGTGSVETTLKKKDGSAINVLLRSSPIYRDNISAGVTFTVLDITEMKKAEKSLLQSEVKYRTMMEALKDPVYICSQDQRIEYLNPAMIKRIGRDATGETCYRAINENSDRCPWCIDEVRAVNEHVVNEFISPKDNKHFQISSSAFYNEDGTISKITILRDNTEIDRVKDQLQQAQKMEAIGTLAGGIAHDFNNILSPILIHSEMVLDDLPEDNPLRMNLNEIYRAGERAKELVKQILTFARKKEKVKVPLKTSLIVKETVQFLRSTTPTTISIQFGNLTKEDTILADPTQLNQILMNLCTNAVYAMRNSGGTLEISLEKIEIDTDTNIRYQNLMPGAYLQLKVKDTGHGMDYQTVRNIFEPYFTTKSQGEGTGLGLAVVHGIVKDYGGEIFVESRVGEGTTFDVLFPSIETTVPVDVKDKKEMPKGNERILFVDDESIAVKANRALLENLGYKVTSTTRSPHALEIFKKNPKNFDLIITDMTMPKMTGKGLANEVMAVKPDIPVILCTGFSEDIDEAEADKIGIRKLLFKPVSMHEMAAVIRDILDNSQLQS